jgi:lipopolysaccharide/colanic/teichoic acid biosynthesis glycosyltransferase
VVEGDDSGAEIIAGELAWGLPETIGRSSALDERKQQAHVGHFALKRAIDVAVAATALTLLSPILLLVALAVWLESRGPILYGDEREGMNGRGFRCWKFRTMVVGAHAVQLSLKGLDKMDGPHFKLDRDPRVTRIGRLLRALNLDELPQLINVLVGEMSLVGPRPSPFRENQICVPWREARLSVRPGITGCWQVCRHNRAAGDFHQWIEYDLLYVQHMSLWLDVKIIAATLLTLGGKMGHVPAERLIPSIVRSEPSVKAHEKPALELITGSTRGVADATPAPARPSTGKDASYEEERRSA